jgi:hypothetical protein
MIGDAMDPVLLASNSTIVMGQLAPQMASLTPAMPHLLSLGPNTEQLVNMGRAMFQGALTIPPASPVQASYIQGIQELAGVISQAAKAAQGGAA